MANGNFKLSQLLNVDEMSAEQRSHFFDLMLTKPDCEIGQMMQRVVVDKVDDMIKERKTKDPVIVHEVLSQKEQNKLMEIYPEFNIVFKDDKNMVHGFAAAERKLQALLLLDRVPALQEVDDIGGQWSFWVTRGEKRIHSCCPNLDIRDDQREISRQIFLTAIGDQARSGKRQMSENELWMYDQFRENITAPNAVRCNNTYQGCTCRGFSDGKKKGAQYAIALHSLYDFKLKDLMATMVEKKTRVVHAAMLFAPESMLVDEGPLPSVDGYYMKKNGKIYFGFEKDPSFSYIHDWEEYKKYLLGKPVSYQGNVFYFEPWQVRGDTMLFSIYRIAGVPRRSLSSQEYYRRIYISRWENMVVVPIFDLVESTRELVKKDLFVEKQFMDKCLDYIARLSDQQLTISNVKSYLSSNNWVLFINGAAVKNKQSVDSRDLQLLAQTLLVKEQVARPVMRELREAILTETKPITSLTDVLGLISRKLWKQFANKIAIGGFVGMVGALIGLYPKKVLTWAKDTPNGPELSYENSHKTKVIVFLSVVYAIGGITLMRRDIRDGLVKKLCDMFDIKRGAHVLDVENPCRYYEINDFFSSLYSASESGETVLPDLSEVKAKSDKLLQQKKEIADEFLSAKFSNYSGSSVRTSPPSVVGSSRSGLGLLLEDSNVLTQARVGVSRKVDDEEIMEQFLSGLIDTEAEIDEIVSAFSAECERGETSGTKVLCKPLTPPGFENVLPTVKPLANRGKMVKRVDYFQVMGGERLPKRPVVSGDNSVDARREFLYYLDAERVAQNDEIMSLYRDYSRGVIRAGGQNYPHGLGVWDVEMKNWCIRPVVTEHAYVFQPDKRMNDWSGYLEVAVWERGMLVNNFAVERMSDYVIVCDQTYLCNNRLILDNLSALDLGPVNCSFELVDGVPGCGKSTMIVNSANPCVDVVLSTGRAATDDLIERFASKGFPCKLKRRVKTVDSFLMHCVDGSLTGDVLHFDEALMAHAGMVYFCAQIAGAKRCICQGDQNQISFKPRVSQVNLRFSSLVGKFDVVTEKRETYRSPADVAAVLNKYYTGDVRTHNATANSMTVRKIVSKEQVSLKPGAQYITFLQSEKKELVNLLALRKVAAKVSTVHESQGETFKDVVLVRTKPTDDSIARGREYLIVALSRHTQSLVYETVKEDDVSKEIRESAALTKAALARFFVTETVL